MPQPMHVLDSCRIRNGVVVALTSQTATVRSRGLQFDGRRLALGPLEDRPARRNVGSGSFVPDLRIGDRVAVHWDLICDRLDADEAGSLEHWTDWQLQQTNPRLGRSSERPAAGRGLRSGASAARSGRDDHHVKFYSGRCRQLTVSVVLFLSSIQKDPRRQ